MRKTQLVFFACFGTAVIGCTTLLGNFEVDPNAGGGGFVDSGGGDAQGDGQGGQTLCGDTLVDTKTNAAHCGACNRACPAGLTCGDGDCQCPDKGAYCDGQCYSPTDRQHCGATCSVCTGNQVCQGNCVDPPAPAFDKLPRNATGWKDAANAPLTITVKSTGQPGSIYECRTGPAATFTPTVPAWGNCDGANGEGLSHQPKEDAVIKEGTYRTEHRYKLGAYLSPATGITYYVHKSLDGVASCPRQGVPLDGPHFEAEKYFQVATAWAIANPGQFPITAKFPDGGAKPTDAIYLGNPWIKIPFSGIHRTTAMGAEYDANRLWPEMGKDYVFNERALRHRYTINNARNLILVTRQYIHPATNDCKNPIEVGKPNETQYGPPGVTRGLRKIDCEGYVLNTKGNAICLVPSGDKLDVVPVDTRIPGEDNLDGGSTLVTKFSTTAGSTQIVAATVAPALDANMVGGYLQVPESFGRWYKISYVDPNKKFVYVTETVPYAFANASVRFTRQQPLSTFVVPSGFAKLHQNHHAWATGQLNGGVPKPSHRNKCDTPGCNAGKPWLTFLPP